MTRRIALACNSDAGYAPYAATMLYSALLNTPGTQFCIYYLHDPDFPDATRNLIRQALACFGSRAEISFIPVPDSLVSGLPLFKSMQHSALRPVMWYRVFLPQLVPHEPKVLYLDCDTLVVDCLDPIWETGLEKSAIAAVTNPIGRSKSNETPWPLVCGLSSGDDYFNSGVMLMNLDYFRSHDITRRVVEHGLANADWVKFGDQDSLVVVLHDARVSLHPRWNLLRLIIMTGDARKLFGQVAVSEAIRRPAIIHFEGTTKPWLDPTQHPYGRLFSQYARRLPWPTTRMSIRLLDIENFLTRHEWVRLRKAFRRLRQGLQKQE